MRNREWDRYWMIFRELKEMDMAFRRRMRDE